MNQGKLVFAQLMQHLPLTTFRRCVTRYQGERKVQSFSCLDQFLSMAFAQLTYRKSLRDIEACLRAQRSKLYHLVIRSATVCERALWCRSEEIGLRTGHDHHRSVPGCSSNGSNSIFGSKPSSVPRRTRSSRRSGLPCRYMS